jgi:hypothetical protein
MHGKACNIYYIRHPAVILKISFCTFIKSRIITQYISCSNSVDMMDIFLLYCLQSNPINEESKLFC